MSKYKVLNKVELAVQYELLCSCNVGDIHHLVKDVTELHELKSSDSQAVNCKVGLDLRAEKEK